MSDFVDLRDDAIHDGPCFVNEVVMLQICLTVFPHTDAERIDSRGLVELQVTTAREDAQQRVQTALGNAQRCAEAGEAQAVWLAAKRLQDIKHAACGFDAGGVSLRGSVVVHIYEL